jgi:hypothetical protein
MGDQLGHGAVQRHPGIDGLVTPRVTGAVDSTCLQATATADALIPALGQPVCPAGMGQNPAAVGTHIDPGLPDLWNIM